MKNSFLLVFILFYISNFAQDSLTTKKITFDFSGYIDAYYAYDFDNFSQQKRHSFLYNYNRHNEFNVNIALIRASVYYENIYAKLSLHGGTYVDDNYANEDIKNINEAYLGLYLNPNKNSYIEVGILPSYIGFETAISHSNLTGTRSILAENSPYFMTGIKYNRQFSKHWTIAALITNGWQRINRIDRKGIPAFGTQIIYKPSENSTLNWSTFFGKEYFQNELGMRYFSNLYWDRLWNSKWRTIVGFDFGIQNTSNLNEEHFYWMSPVGIIQYKMNTKWQAAYRFEYYQDKNNVIITNSNLPFETLGNSINFDFLPNSKAKIRTEAKWYHAKENSFDLATKKDNFSITTSLSFEF